MGTGTRPTALVTGASSGLGECFARTLAATGYDLVLVARGRSSLERLGLELEQQHGTASEVMAADLADAAQLDGVAERLRTGDPVDVVVNNAGFGHYGRFVDLAVDGEAGQVTVNALAVLVLSHAALGAMVRRGSGSLLNVASIAGFAPTPHSATYSATKSFVIFLSEALHDEVAPRGVHVTVLCPGFTRTDFQQRAGVRTDRLPSFAWSDAQSVVDHGLAALERNQAVCVPGALNKITAASPRFAPRGLVRRISAQVMRRMES
ncbi:MAG TPA: SDR family oxidoreductase [Acidimicrobiales bacterium]|nr:SDR family oxidoreductase [Acidimicrobiales bacterium]